MQIGKAEQMQNKSKHVIKQETIKNKDKNTEEQFTAKANRLLLYCIV